MKCWKVTTPVVVAAMSVAAACAGYGGSAGGPPVGTGQGAGGANGGTGPSGAKPGSGGSGSTPPVVDAAAPTAGPVPPTSNPPPSSAAYVRGSLVPVYGLIPRAQYGVNDPLVKGQPVALADSDLEAAANQINVSAAERESDVGALISQDNGGAPVAIIANADDQQRAALIPFRGKPSDVKLVTLGGQTQLFVPLGGDVMTVGSEVSVLSVANGAITPIQRLTVGVRPQRLAVHPAGLVFVCNQYSNYISIIDPRTDDLLRNGSKPVEIPTEYMCADLAFVAAPDGNPDHQFLYVANRWRHSVLKYEAFVVRDASNNPIDVVQPDNANPSPANSPITEILNVGNNPFRLNLSDQQTTLFVANNKGGEVAAIQLGSDAVSARVSIGAPSADIVNINDLLFVPTTMPARGLLSNVAQQVPAQVTGAPVVVTGLDNQAHVANPGALFDDTNSYQFEDTRNGLQQLDLSLAAGAANNFYYTDSISPEANFQATQKVLAGAGQVAIARNGAGTLIWLADSSSDLVEELAVNVASSPNAATATGRTFKTQHRPFAITVDEPNNRLFVADWGSELVEQIDLASGQSVAQADTGYAQPPYPASNVENGEFYFYNAIWSNNGRKSCATCHFDELDADGFGFSQGAVSPTTMGEVKPNHNLGTTGAYFWNGSFANGNYTSLAFGAETRDNCELVEFGFVEGAGSDPATRVGDPNNLFTNGQDAQCRPVNGAPGETANAAQIAAVDQAEQQIAQGLIQKNTGFQFEELARIIDAYSVFALRLPPNPLHQEYLASKAGAPQLDSQALADIQNGEALFRGQAACAACHLPDDPNHPFTDDLNHGSGVSWIGQFIDTYQNDPRVTAVLPNGFPETMLDALPASLNDDHEVNTWTKLDYFIFACFDLNNCLEFDDPLAVRGDTAEETRRLNLLVQVNLLNPDRLFIPGDVVGQAYVNTPSLRGVWSEANLLHHGLAHSIREAILAPGHPALEPDENGFAIDQFGKIDVHGLTSTLSAAQVNALVRYVESIE